MSDLHRLFGAPASSLSASEPSREESSINPVPGEDPADLQPINTGEGLAPPAVDNMGNPDSPGRSVAAAPSEAPMSRPSIAVVVPSLGSPSAQSCAGTAEAGPGAHPGCPPASEWCIRCVRLVGRDPLKAGSGFICTRHEHAPCRYCTRDTHQECKPLPERWVRSAERVVGAFNAWSVATGMDASRAHEELRCRYLVFNREARVTNLPEDERPAPRPRRSRRGTSRATSRATSRERSRSPRPANANVRFRSTSPAPRGRSPPSVPFDNRPELADIIEKLIDEARNERAEGRGETARVNMWGFIRDFYR